MARDRAILVFILLGRRGSRAEVVHRARVGVVLLLVLLWLMWLMLLEPGCCVVVVGAVVVVVVGRPQGDGGGRCMHKLGVGGGQLRILEPFYNGFDRSMEVFNLPCLGQDAVEPITLNFR